MKRSIACRVLMILCVFVTVQVICGAAVDESSEVYKAVSENKVGLVTHMITTKGFEKASRQLEMSPLREVDINPTVGDEDDTVAKKQPRHIRHKSLGSRVSTIEKPDEEIQNYTKTEIDGEPEEEMSQSINNQPEIGNDETMTTRRDDESQLANDNDESKKFGDYTYRLNSVSEHPRVKRAKSKNKELEYSRSAASNQ
ncbi:uncharacterized protein LOC112598558 [Melanaphis sacchari]|uniref:uncharacterized protein LOC112598558 n=1 Tax=Melanaphis sacchari TaxID=742174 RepID=UPI000DC14BE8|nr:uncharacterized protein LOC112598558 [Melanaphis sacchari]